VNPNVSSGVPQVGNTGQPQQSAPGAAPGQTDFSYIGLPVPQAQRASQATGMPMAANPTNLISATGNVGNQMIRQQNQINAAQSQNANTAAAIETKESQDLDPAYQAAITAAKQNQERVLAAQNHVAEQTKRFMDNHEQMTQHIADQVKADPQSFFEKAGVSKTTGIIGLILGGLGGLVNGGHNTALERLDANIKENIAEQQRKAELAEKAGHQYENLFSMAHQNLGDTNASNAAMYNAALDYIKAQTDRLANGLRGTKAQQRANELKAELDSKRAENSRAIYAQTSAGFEKGIQLQLESEKIQASQAADAGKQLGIKGFVGNIPKDIHEKLSMAAGGGRAAIDNLNELEILLSQPLTRETRVQIQALGAMLNSNMTDALGGSKRLPPALMDMISKLAPGKIDKFLPTFFQDLIGIKSKIKASREAIAESIVNKVQTGAPEAQIDPNDPYFGGVIKKKVNISDQQRAREELDRLAQIEKEKKKQERQGKKDDITAIYNKYKPAL